MPEKMDLTGQRFGMLTAIHESENRKGYWTCQCDCGNIKDIIISSLTHGRTKSCGCLKIKDLSGQRFGMLTVLNKSETRKNYWVCKCDCGNIAEYLDRQLTAGAIESCGCVHSDLANLTGHRIGRLTILHESEQKKDYWLCQCDCGNQKEIKGKDLRAGNAVSCGCALRKKMDMTGQRIGMLTVLRESTREERLHPRKVCWVCKCDCGKELIVTGQSLRIEPEAGHPKSCGCAMLVDYTNQRFGKLTVLRKAERNGFWLCRCDCGKTKEVLTRALRDGYTQSCGCLDQKSREQTQRVCRETKTNPFLLRDGKFKKPLSNNTSGVRGVYWHKARKQWVARITFQGVGYFLKSSSDIQKCIDARKEAEEALFGNFLEWYEETYGKDFMTKTKQAREQRKLRAEKKKLEKDENE